MKSMVESGVSVRFRVLNYARIVPENLTLVGDVFLHHEVGDLGEWGFTYQLWHKQLGYHFYEVAPNWSEGAPVPPCVMLVRVSGTVDGKPDLFNGNIIGDVELNGSVTNEELQRFKDLASILAAKEYNERSRTAAIVQATEELFPLEE